MQDMMARLVDVPMARMFVLTGIIFLLVAVLGKIEGKIEPGNIGRIGASIVGTLLMAGGLAMYFLEGDMIRGRLESVAPERGRANVMRDATAKSAARPPGPAQTAPPAAEKGNSGIQVVAATYGRNCGAKSGNATAHLARACDGRSVCDYRIDITGIEDPAPSCDKDYVAEWKCGGATNVYTVGVPSGAARGEHVRIACAGG